MLMKMCLISVSQNEHDTHHLNILFANGVTHCLIVINIPVCKVSNWKWKKINESLKRFSLRNFSCSRTMLMMKELLCMKFFIRQINGYNDLSYWNRNSQLHTSLCLDDPSEILEKRIVVGLEDYEQFQAEFISHYYHFCWWIMPELGERKMKTSNHLFVNPIIL